jgi:hypothetical protein
MSTTKPRITVTLEPHAHRVLSKLSELSGDSMSQIVCGFVDLAVPSLERVVVLMQRAKDAPEEVNVGMAAAIERAEKVMLPQLQLAIAQNDLFISDVEAASISASRPTVPPDPAIAGSGGRKAARVPQTPGLVTRGSGLDRGRANLGKSPKKVGKTLVRGGSKGGRHGAL